MLVIILCQRKLEKQSECWEKCCVRIHKLKALTQTTNSATVEYNFHERYNSKMDPSDAVAFNSDVSCHGIAFSSGGVYYFCCFHW